MTTMDSVSDHRAGHTVGKEKTVDVNEKTTVSSPPPPSPAGRTTVVPTRTSASLNVANESDGDDDDEQPKLPMSKARCIALVITLTGAAFLNIVSNQSVVIILPTVGRELSVPESRLQWIVSSYALTFGCFLLVWGRIADIYGKRLIFIWGSVWVTVVTAVNPFLPNEIAFDLFRGLHGLGAAANVPTAIGIIGTTFPSGRAKNYAFSCYAAGAPLGGAFGNIVSGLIANYTSWKWVFGVTAIMAGIIAIAGYFLIPLPPTPPPAAASISVPSSSSNQQSVQTSQKQTIDWIGATLITVGLTALMFALTEGNVVGWKTPWIPALVVIAILIVAAFAVWSWYLENKTSRPPLLKMSLFKNRRFTIVLVTSLLVFGAFNNFMVFATYYYQQYQGLSVLETALRFVPVGLSGLIVAFCVAQILDRVPTLFILGFGHLCLLTTLILFASPIPPSTSYFAWGLPAMLLSVMGSDTAWPCLMLSTSRELSTEDQAMGGALFNAMGQFGRAIGLAIATSVQTAVIASELDVPVEDVGRLKPHNHAALLGIRAASWLSVGMICVALVLVVITFKDMDIVGRIAPASRREEMLGDDDEEAERTDSIRQTVSQRTV